MSDWCNALLVLFATLIGFGYLYVKNQFLYWKTRKIPYVQPSFPLGNLQGFRTKYHSTEFLQNFYNQFVGKTPFGGMYFLTRPVGVVIDPELIKNILVRDFNSFVERGLYYNEEIDPLSAHLFALDGAKWRRLRNKLSPTFTSGKMKLMFDIMSKTADDLTEYLQDAADKKEELEFRELFCSYGTDVIGSCAFGIECNSLKDPDNEFLLKSKSVIQPSKIFLLFQSIAVILPKVGKLLKIRMVEPQASEFFIRLVRETVEYRKKNNVKRNDFLQQLMNLEKSENQEDDNGIALTIEEMTAQAFVFFVAGFETSATTVSFSLFEMGRHHDIQQKVRDEIESILTKHDGKVTYESVGEMHYMNKVIKETLRLYPPADVLMRSAITDYSIPDTDYKLEKGQMVLFPIYAMHRDPLLYPDPLKFDPERFNAEETAKRHPFAYLPFGEGPRNCIGMRFGLMQVQLGLIAILRKYKVSHSTKTPKEIKFIPSAQTPMIEGGIWLKLENLSDK